MEEAMVTTDMFLMSAVRALLGREPDRYNYVSVSDTKKKISAVYLDRSGLPFFSQIKVTFGDKEVSLNDFKYAYFEMRDRIYEIAREMEKEDGQGRDEADRPAGGREQEENQEHQG